MPNVSGYLLVGLLLGPSFFSIVSSSDVKSLEIISELALAFIAFSIVIASMSAATAPAATLLVIRQYRADGPLTRTILPVVALDDILGIMAFGIAMSLAKMSVSGIRPSLITLLVDLSIEILGSLLAGLIIGFVLTIVLRKLKSHDDYQVVSLIAISIGVGISNLLGLSPLLTNIMIGATLVNLLPRPDKAFNSINNFVPAFYVLFFTLAGASLDLGILKTIGAIGIAYVLARGLGKYLGSFIGSLSVKAEEAVTKYMGLALLPQGGVSIGLSVLVRKQLPEYATAITTLIMFSILIYETTGPIFAKIAINKAGEIKGQDNYRNSKAFEEEVGVKGGNYIPIEEGSGC